MPIPIQARLVAGTLQYTAKAPQPIQDQSILVYESNRSVGAVGGIEPYADVFALLPGKQFNYDRQLLHLTMDQVIPATGTVILARVFHLDQYGWMGGNDTRKSARTIETFVPRVGREITGIELGCVKGLKALVVQRDKPTGAPWLRLFNPDRSDPFPLQIKWITPRGDWAAIDLLTATKNPELFEVDVTLLRPAQASRKYRGAA